MKVLPLALSIVAAGLATASTILFLTNRGDKLRAQAEVVRLGGELANARTQLSAGTAREQKLAKDLEGSAELQRAAEKALGEARLKSADLAASLAQSRNLLSLREQNEAALTREIARLKDDLASANTRLAEIPRLKAQVDGLEQTLALTRNRVAPDGSAVPETAGSPGAVLALGPEDAFLVANIGSRSGAAAGRKLLVRRGTEFIATAIISDVHEQVCIAQVDPRSLRESLRKGDSLVLAP